MLLSRLTIVIQDAHRIIGVSIFAIFQFPHVFHQNEILLLHSMQVLHFHQNVLQPFPKLLDEPPVDDLPLVIKPEEFPNYNNTTDTTVT